MPKGHQLQTNATPGAFEQRWNAGASWPSPPSGGISTGRDGKSCLLSNICPLNGHHLTVKQSQEDKQIRNQRTNKARSSPYIPQTRTNRKSRRRKTTQTTLATLKSRSKHDPSIGQNLVLRKMVSRDSSGIDHLNQTRKTAGDLKDLRTLRGQCPPPFSPVLIRSS